MTDEQATQFMARFGRAFFSGEPQALASVVAADAQWHFAIGEEPDGRVHHGIDGFIQGKAANERLIENLRFEDVCCRALGEQAIVMTYRVTGRWRASGQTLDRRGIELIELRDGRLNRKDVFWKQGTN
ncbi:MAG: nuclear transport factor 2 family protein [Burkholderiaceae bacterium]